MSKIQISKDAIDIMMKHMSYWFDPKNTEAINRASKEQDIKLQSFIESGYIIEANGVCYTEREIFEGKCPLNGTLYNMGYRSNPDGTWRKA